VSSGQLSPDRKLNDRIHPFASCTEESMDAFASLGGTKKRDLNAGDIAGIKGLY
jgi:hypothetical protein